MAEYFVLIKPTEALGFRRIYIKTHRGETFHSLEEAIEMLTQLTVALERAIDPTPLPVPEPVMRKLSPSTNPSPILSAKDIL